MARQDKTNLARSLNTALNILHLVVLNTPCLKNCHYIFDDKLNIKLFHYDDFW